MSRTQTPDIFAPALAILAAAMLLAACSAEDEPAPAAESSAPASAAPASNNAANCDDACLEGLMADYLDAMLAFEQMDIPAVIGDLPWAEIVGFTENDVGLMMGDGLWGTATAIEDGYVLTDPENGNVLWYGVIEEHGQPAYIAIRIGVDGDRIAEVETVAGREGTPAPFASTAAHSMDPAFSAELPEPDRMSRNELTAIVSSYYDALPGNDGTVNAAITDDCERLVNGFSVTHGSGVDLQGCRQQLEAGLYRYVERIRALRFPIVDESKGVVVAVAFIDHAARFVEYETLDGVARTVPIEYPNTHSVLEIFRIEGGQVSRIDGVAAFQPYLMPTKWMP